MSADEELPIDVEDYVEKHEETEEQKQFNTLSANDKFERLNQLVKKSQVYSQIILDNMMEKAMEKKRLAAEAALKPQKEEEVEDTKPQKKEEVHVISDEDDSDLEVIEVRRSLRRLKDASREARRKKRRQKSVKDEPKTKKKKTSARELAQGQVSEKTKQTKAAIERAQTGHNQIQPALVSGCTMKDYQLDGLEWLVSLYENGLNGILADEMGLGKTLQCIALYAHLLENGVKGPFLVVAPLSTVGNWCLEFKRFAPEIDVVKYTGSKSSRQPIKFSQAKLKHSVVVTSYEIMIKDFLKFARINWEYMTVDEGHRLKNFESVLIQFLKRLRAGNRLLLTGTPLQNNLKELWSLLNFILPDIFHDLELFELWFSFNDLADDSEKDSVSNDEKKVIQEKLQLEFINSLHKILKPFLLRRMKRDVIKDLPPKKEYIVFTNLSPLQKILYQGAMNNRLPETIKEIYVKEYLLKAHSDLFKTKDDLEMADKIMHERAKKQNPKSVLDKRMRRGVYTDEQLAQIDSSLGPRATRRRNRQKAIEEAASFVNPAAPDSDYEEPMDTKGKKEAGVNYGKQMDISENKQQMPEQESEEEMQFLDLPKLKGSILDETSETSSDTSESTQFESAVESGSASLVEVDSQSDATDESEDEECINISDEELTPEELRHAKAVSALNKVEREMKRFNLRNPMMQFRNICGSPYLYYDPYPIDYDDRWTTPFANDVLQKSGKVRMLHLLVEKLIAENHKILIFSQFTKMLDLLALHFDEYDIAYSRLDGDVKQEDRDAEIAAFSRVDGSQVFLLSTRAGGLGLNLIQADTVIIFDNDWNPQMDIQAMDRVHRIGQEKPVKVIRFVMKNTFEEIMIMRSFSKRALEKMVILEGNFRLGRVAEKLAKENIDISVLETSVKSMRDLNRRLNLHESSGKIDMSQCNDILLGNDPEPEPELLTEEEIAEIMDRSPECYLQKPRDFPNMTAFESAYANEIEDDAPKAEASQPNAESV